LALRGGGNDFQATVELLERLDVPWCLIGGLAVNAYAEPVYTADADFVIVTTQREARLENPRSLAEAEAIFGLCPGVQKRILELLAADLRKSSSQALNCFDNDKPGGKSLPTP
jgi:hypothetical protein